MGQDSPLGVPADVSRDGVGTSSRAVGPSAAELVTVSMPGTLPAPRVTLSYYPDSVDEFEQLVEFFGGPGTWTGATLGFAFLALSDRVTVHLMRPASSIEPRPLDPFMQRFQDRITAAKGAA